MTSQQLTAPLIKMWHGLGQAMRDAAVMRDIERMDDRMLQDLGVSRAQAEYQAMHRRNRDRMSS